MEWIIVAYLVVGAGVAVAAGIDAKGKQPARYSGIGITRLAICFAIWPLIIVALVTLALANAAER